MRSKIKTIVVSPSGSYYGSEQVLHEHLIHSKSRFKVYVRAPGSFLEILKSSETKHVIVGFRNVTALYFKILIQLLFSSIESLYVNEGGHIRYVRLLAKLFPSKKFLIHIRLVEDTKCKRIGNDIPENFHCVCVSHFIKGEIVKNNPLVASDQLVTVHDYYLPSSDLSEPEDVYSEVIKVGVIGRVSSAKGVSKAKQLLCYWEESIGQPLECYFYGDVMDDEDVLDFKKCLSSFKRVKVHLMGFAPDKNEFFDTFNIVIHFNEAEPFPRVYFDAMARLKPVTGFNSGGIAEQASLFSFVNNLVPLGKNWKENMAGKIIEMNESLNEQRMKIFQKRHVFTSALNIKSYMREVEKFL